MITFPEIYQPHMGIENHNIWKTHVHVGHPMQVDITHSLNHFHQNEHPLR